MTHAILTVDLGFGDAGKGSVVDYLARAEAAHTVVRFNGGAQAAHRVVTPDGREHVFSQFGSGCFAGAATHLSRFMLIDPPAMLTEAAHLAALGCPEILARTTIEAEALVLTPYTRAINRLRELARGNQRHGSCGMGIGETMQDQLRYGPRVLRAGDLADPATVATKLQFTRALALSKLEALRPSLPDTATVAQELAPLYDRALPDWLAETYAQLADQLQIVGNHHLAQILARPGSVIFEAAQGVLLDEWYGLHPYTTWSTTTLANANQLLAEAGFSGPLTRLGISRAYSTRHGAGPLPSEDPALTRALPDARNQAHPWQQHFRVGWLDLVLLRYALAVVGPLDGLALTCLDRLAERSAPQICYAYQTEATRLEHLAIVRSPDLIHQQALTDLIQRCRPVLRPISAAALPDYLEQHLGLPILLRSYGPTAHDKQAGRDAAWGIPSADPTRAPYTSSSSKVSSSSSQAS
ncbi:MAG: adenylosuccinate synthetase [Oscillochloridaceae bacterium umkhey_bin13]